MATMKNTVIIYVDEHGKVYTAAGQHIDPREALRLAWVQICRDAHLTWVSHKPEKPQQPAPAQPQPAPARAATAPPPPTPGEADEPRCPVHNTSRPSRYGGLHCPMPNPSGEGYCQWSFGKSKTSNGRK